MQPISEQSIGSTKSAPLDIQSKAKLQRAVKEFESIFVGYLLKEMRSSVPKSDLFGESFGGDLVEGMFDSELAKHITRNGNLGLARLLYRQITGEELPGTTASPVRVLGAEQVQSQHAGLIPPGKEIPKRTTLSERLKPFEPIIMEAAEKHGVDANLIRAVIASESAGNPAARSRKHAKGLMQLIDSTATAVGVRDVWNPRENILGGSKYLKQLLDRNGGDITLALASYNAGPAAVEKYGGIPPYEETQEYVERALRYLKHFEQLDLVNSNDR